MLKESDMGWTSAGIPGVQYKRLAGNGATGASIFLYSLEAGVTIPAHWHRDADETTYVLAGDFVENGKTYGPGTSFFAKAQTVHGPHHTVSGCLVLFHVTADAEFNLATPAGD